LAFGRAIIDDFGVLSVRLSGAVDHGWSKGAIGVVNRAAREAGRAGWFGVDDPAEGFEHYYGVAMLV